MEQQAQSENQEAIRVLVVDDSAFMRLTISNALNSIPNIIIVGTARNGVEALELIPKLNPSVITLDVEMPQMDGLTTLRRIMNDFPRPVVMLSSLTKEGASETVHALTIGAVDFIAKPTSKANLSAIEDELVSKVIRASQTKVYPAQRQGRTARPAVIKPKKVIEKQTRMLRSSEKVLVIGASTGGPRALSSILTKLPKDIPAAILIVQHMPVGFTAQLAERFDRNSQIKVKEAEEGDQLEVGLAIIAKGGFHMVLDAESRVSLNQAPTVHGVRPAVDVTMTAVAERFGKRSVGVVLTGMGRDGTNGAMLIHAAEGKVIAESQESSVVWGMPRSVVESGAADEVVPLEKMVPAILEALKG